MSDVNKFGGYSAILVGALSILYAIFYLVIARQAEYLGILGSWFILALSGIFTSAAYVGLYRRVSSSNEGYALWALLLGVGASFATLQHGVYQTLLVSGIRPADETVKDAIDLVQQIPSQVNPAGLATFFMVGLAIFLFNWLIVHSGALPRSLGYLGIFNAVLLTILFIASANDLQLLILISGGLTSVIVGPIWWIWLGLVLMREQTSMPAPAVKSSDST